MSIQFPFRTLAGLLVSWSMIAYSQSNFINDYEPVSPEGNVRVVIEIPAGTTEKWEVTKPLGALKWERRDGKNRVIDYLAYPANYGMIPRTILPVAEGGDGDPLDAIIIGPAVDRGTVVEAMLIGVLRLRDNGERDDKLITVLRSSGLCEIKSIADLDANYPGISEILTIWFSNYKGAGVTRANGFGEAVEARKILNQAITDFDNREDRR